MKPKKAIKFFAVTTMLFAIIMAIWGAYESFSQSATSHDWDWALRIYLAFASATFLGLMLCARNRAEKFKLFFLKVYWRIIYFITGISFIVVGATNVSDYSISPDDYDGAKVIAHMISTGIAAFCASMIAWHYFPKNSDGRRMSMAPVLIGILLFIGSLFEKDDWLTTAIGEACITFFILTITWVIINEQIKKE